MMSVQGSVTATVQSTAKSTTSTTNSKARLLFNSDGSVKLLGDPAVFGIDPQSHILVPTVGVDGAMIMLLAPTGSGGKTFILSPTNGGTLPSLNTILPTSTISPQFIASKPSVQKTSPTVLKTSTTVLKTSPTVPKTSPTVLTPSEMKALPKKAHLTSLLQSSKFVTHMRIDPSGACVSKIRMPVYGDSTSASSSGIPLQLPHPSSLSHPSLPEHMVGSTLKAIAEHLKSQSQSVNSMSGLRTPGIPLVTVRYPVVPVRSPTVRYPIPPLPSPSTNESKHTSTFVSNSQWTKLNSVIPAAIGKFERMLSADRLSKLAVVSEKSEASHPEHVSLPTVPPISGTDAPQKPGNDRTSPVVAGLVISPSRTQLTGTTGPVPTMIFTHDYGAGLKGSQSVAIGRASKAQLEREAKSQQIRDATEAYAVDAMSRSSGIDSQTAALKKTTTVSQPSVASSESENSSANVSNCSTESSWELDPNTGRLLTQKDEAVAEEEQEDGVLSIKIDSVFSLAMDLDDENSSTRKRKNSDSKPVLPIEIKTEKESDVCQDTLPSEPTQVTCPPCYVVLEQLSRSQIENDTQNMFKCSNHCRVRTLNFLCSLGLVECEPVVHTIRPDLSSPDVDEISDSQTKDECPSDVTVSHTADSSTLTDKDMSSPEVPVSVESGPSLNKVRKVEPGSHGDASKVIRFIKMERKPDGSRMPLHISLKSLIPKSNRGAPRSLLGKVPIKMKTPILDVSTDTVGLTEQAQNQTVTISSTAASQCHPSASPISATSVVDKMNISNCQNTVPKPSELHCKYTMASNTAITSVSTAKPTVMLGNIDNKITPSMLLNQSTLVGKLPVTKVQTDSKKHYYLVTVNGQRILVPIDNTNLSAYLFNGKVGAKTSNTTDTKDTVPVPATVQQPADKSQSKRPPDTSKDPVPAKVPKDSSASDASKTTYTLPAGVKIKPEPKTRGYGDEDTGTNTTPKKKKSKVKVKKELINSEWEEIWSSGTRPLENPTDACSTGETLTASITKPNVTDTLSSTLTSSSYAVDTRAGADADDVMPELPLMKLPSTEEIAKKSEAQGNRIEKLKAMLKENEMLIEQLKRERVEESVSIDDDTVS